MEGPAERDREKYSGPFIMHTGYMLLAFVPVLVRVANRAGWETGSTVFARFVIACVCIAVVALVGGQKLRSGNPRVLLLRGLFGGGAVLSYFAAVEETNASTAVLLNFTHSIWANVAGVLLLGQKPIRGFWPLLALAAVGLYLVIDPGFDGFKRGEMLGLLSGVLGGGAILCVKELRKTDNATTIQASLAVVGVVCALPFVLPAWLQSPTPPAEAMAAAMAAVSDGAANPFTSPAFGAWLAVLAMGICGYAGQHFFTSGYRDTSVQLGTLLSLTTPLYATFMGRLLLGEILSFKFLLGASFILVACMMVGLRERQASRNHES